MESVKENQYLFLIVFTNGKQKLGEEQPNMYRIPNKNLTLFVLNIEVKMNL